LAWSGSGKLRLLARTVRGTGVGVGVGVKVGVGVPTGVAVAGGVADSRVSTNAALRLGGGLSVKVSVGVGE